MSDHNHPPQGRRQPGQSSLHRNPSVLGGGTSGGSTAAGPSQAGPSSAGSDSGGGQPGSKSPLNLGLGFLKGLGVGDRKNRDGQPAKRRGPKPDSKPALTRRQELNRQAQRTHREKKEFYIKTLEQQVMQLKEVYTGSIQEKQHIIQENQKLKNLLSMHGIAYESRGGGNTQGFPDPTGASSSASHPASHPGTSYGGTTYQTGPSSGFSPQSQPMSSQSVSPGPGYLSDASLGQVGQQQLDYDQLGVDFVLALEAACMDHLQFMIVRSMYQSPTYPSHIPHPPDTSTSQPSFDEDPSSSGTGIPSSLDLPVNGHALMWSAPPASHIDNDPESPYPHKMPNMPNQELMKLLLMSGDLPLDAGGGEITPVMALAAIMRDERVQLMDRADWERVKRDLAAKTRCYGFGAVLEDFELRDALNSIFNAKLDVGR